MCVCVCVRLFIVDSCAVNWWSDAFCAHTYTPSHTYTHTHTHTHTHTYIQTYVHTFIHTYIHTYIHACIHTCILTYTHSYTPMGVVCYLFTLLCHVATFVCVPPVALSAVPEEPAAGPGVVALTFRLPSGSRVTRRFALGARALAHASYNSIKTAVAPARRTSMPRLLLLFTRC
jgi:hypothetical protein